MTRPDKLNAKRFILFAFVVGLCLFVSHPAFAGYDEGLSAYNRGDYATALREWKPLALKGDANAQHSLGFMYAEGHGVPRNITMAVMWYRNSAEQGHSRAQYALGVRYAKGDGVRQDYVLAYMWWEISASQGTAVSAIAAKNRDILAKHISPARIVKAKKLARDWVPKK